MNDAFKIGEVATLSDICAVGYAGTDVTVTDGLRERACENTFTHDVEIALTYLVALCSGKEYAARPDQLRKKKPPYHAGTKSSWDADNIWRPNSLKSTS